MPPNQVQGVLEYELGAPLRDVFEWIDLETPLGSASISQVSKSCCTPVTQSRPLYWGAWRDIVTVQPLQGVAAPPAHHTTSRCCRA